MQTYELLESGVTTFGQLYGKINNLVEALRSAFSGVSFPANPVDGQFCYRTDRTDSRGIPKLYIYTGNTQVGEGGWVEVSVFLPSGVEIATARGTKASLNNRLSVSLNDDGTLKSNVSAYQSEWILPSLNFTYVDSNTFTVNGNQTDIYVKKRRLKVNTESGIYYTEVFSSEYNESNNITVVDVVDNVITSDLVSVEYSIIKPLQDTGGSLTAGMLNMIYVSNLTPTNPNITPIWLDTSTEPAILKIYYNGNWVSASKYPMLQDFVYKTTNTMTIYVDADNGSDTTGDGSSSAPFKTVSKALSVIPQVLAHNITIICKKASASYGTLFLSGIQGNANLTIQGEFNTLDSGVVGSFSNAATDPEYGSLGVTCSKVTDATKNWTVNQWKNKLVRIYKGTTEYIRPITYNDETSVYFADTSISGIDDTWSYEIVDWGTKFDYVRINVVEPNVILNNLKVDSPAGNSIITYDCNIISLDRCYIKCPNNLYLLVATRRGFFTLYNCVFDYNETTMPGILSTQCIGVYFSVRNCNHINLRSTAYHHNDFNYLVLNFEGGCRFYSSPNYNPAYCIQNTFMTRFLSTTYGKNVIDCGSVVGVLVEDTGMFNGRSNVVAGPNCAKLVEYKGINDRDNEVFYSKRINTTAFEASITTVTANTTLSTSYHTVLVDSSGGARTITLPPVANCAGRIYVIKKIDSSANDVTIDANASETIDGQLTYVLSAQYKYVKIQCDGTGWYVIGNN